MKCLGGFVFGICLHFKLPLNIHSDHHTLSVTMNHTRGLDMNANAVRQTHNVFVLLAGILSENSLR